MSAATQSPIRVAPAPRRPGRPGDRVSLVVGLAVVLAVLADVVASTWTGRRELAGIPAAERAALLSRTVDELRQFCGAGRPAALDDHCRELASFAARFEECRGECEALVRPLLTPIPTR